MSLLDGAAAFLESLRSLNRPSLLVFVGNVLLTMITSRAARQASRRERA
jgi:hypothetical protein